MRAHGDQKGIVVKEYKVEVTEVKKAYFCITVEAESRTDAISKVRKTGLDIANADEHETASQIQWNASVDRGFLNWIKSIF